MPPRQYERAADLNLTARLKLVAKLHMRGFSASRIATELDYDIRRARGDIATITDRYREFEDLDAHLRDVQTRTGEQLTKLNELEATLWKQLEWASEWVPQVEQMGDGTVVHKYEQDTNGNSVPSYGPRKPGMVPQLVGQIQAINKQQAELLGLLNKNVDVTVKLQQTERIQIVMLEAIKSADPKLFGEVRRQIKAVQASVKQTALVTDAGTGQSLEAEYIDAD